MPIAGAVAAGCAIGALAQRRDDPPSSAHDEEHSFSNWSGTHHVRPARLYEPETHEELERIVQNAHLKGALICTFSRQSFLKASGKALTLRCTGERLRCVGSALSPNGIAFSPEGMVSLALLDQILDVDEEAGTVRVQAGARVQEVVEALRPHGLTLQNYASIREQSIGGFTQARLSHTLRAARPYQASASPSQACNFSSLD